MKRKIFYLPVIFIILLNLSCATTSIEAQYKDILREARLGNTDFTFMKLTNYLSSYPDSAHAPEVEFALAEYYYQTQNYRDAIDALTRHIKDYSDSKSRVFAYALLYRLLSEYKLEPQLIAKIKQNLFSNSLLLIFSQSKTKYYKSIFNNTYKIVDYIDKIEIFKNNELFLKITP
jgi:outer membrane protein assembly factor BamD (BamD/ComL family)